MKKLYNKMNLLQKCIFWFLVLVFWFFFWWLISFCSADFWSWTSRYMAFNQTFTQTWTFNQFYFNNLNYNNISVDSVCFHFYKSYITVDSSFYVVVWLWDWNYYYSDSYNLIDSDSSYDFYCFNFSNPLIVSNNQIVFYWLHNSQDYLTDFNFAWVRRDWIYYIRSSQFGWDVVNDFKDVLQNWTLYIGMQLWSWYSPMFVVHWLWYSEAQLSPKFKVNYWNTSHEYELNDNLSIYLKSPVIQDWNTFTYNWKTWLNLFFNGTSQWYDKSNLYLESIFWYNNNIFTPICL